MLPLFQGSILDSSCRSSPDHFCGAVKGFFLVAFLAAVAHDWRCRSYRLQFVRGGGPGSTVAFNCRNTVDSPPLWLHQLLGSCRRQARMVTSLVSIYAIDQCQFDLWRHNFFLLIIFRRCLSSSYHPASWALLFHAGGFVSYLPSKALSFCTLHVSANFMKFITLYTWPMKHATTVKNTPLPHRTYWVENSSHRALQSLCSPIFGAFPETEDLEAERYAVLPAGTTRNDRG